MSDVLQNLSDFEFAVPLEECFEMRPVQPNVRIGLVMGSQSDWSTAYHCAKILNQFGRRFECGIVSAHRTHERLFAYGTQAECRGLKVLIGCAGGSAHLPGMLASLTRRPVLGFGPLNGDFGPWDVLGSMVRMPAGVPLLFSGVGRAGAENAAYAALRILSVSDVNISKQLDAFAIAQEKSVPFAPK